MSFDLSQSLAEAQACIRCGACMEVCPLYQASGQEFMVARGKLSLLQALTANTVPPSRRLREILEYCLLCGACTEKCTAKIATPDLVKAGRAAMHERLGLQWSPALALAFLSVHTDQVLPVASAARPLLHRLQAWVGEHSGLLYRLWPTLTGLLGRLPQLAAQPFSRLAPNQIPGRSKKIIAFFVGCGLEALFPQAGLAFLKICQRLGIEVVIPPRQGCCGLLASCAGEVNVSQDLGRRFLRQFEPLSVDYIVTACASCSYHLKQVHKLFPDGREKQTAVRLSSKIREASEFLGETPKFPSRRYPGLALPPSLVFHDPCHLRRGQQIIEPPRRLLAGVPGLQVLEPPGSPLCCGQGGIFGLCHPEMSGTIGKNTVETYRQTGAATVVTACSGCLVQLASLAPDNLPVRHFLEILAESF
jgi:glycolate oxidase iron-sulfur subunit